MIPKHIRAPLLLLGFLCAVFIYTQRTVTYSITSDLITQPITLTKTDIQQGVYSKPADNGQRVKATFLTVCENGELWNLLPTIQDMENRFNDRYHYDWVFLSDQSFTSEFKKLTSAIISGNTHYGVIDRQEWRFPEHIDPERSLAARLKMDEEGMKNGYSISFRHKVRYWLKYFAKHELLEPYDYFWRVEPKAKITCDIPYDVFRFMQKEKKKYGFLNGLREDPKTLPTIWNSTTDFIAKYNNTPIIPQNNMVRFITTNELGEMFSTCSYWTNFEVGDLNFFRSEPYQTYADEMDKAGGIYYERWGDAPLRTIGVSLLANVKDLHFFTDMGYYFPDFVMCPTEPEMRLQNKCSCNQKKSIMWNPKFCMHKYFIVNDLERPEGWRENMNRGLQS